MRSVIRASLWVSALALTAIASADGYSLRRIPKVGAALKYSMEATFDANGGSGTLKATLLEKTTGIDKDGNFTVQQSQIDASGTFDKEKIDISARTPVTLTYKPNGLVTLISGDLTDANAYRMENLGAVVDPGHPVKIGEVWTNEIKEDKTLKTRAVRAEYKLIGEEKIGAIDTLRIKVLAKENDSDNATSDEFTIWISKEDGSMVQLESKWLNAPFPGASAPIPATIKIVRIES
jgi:hypothetical protein